MKPPSIRYERAETLGEALDFLATDGERTKVLAGGQSLVALLNLRLARPEIVLDISRIAELSGYRQTGGALEVGALTTQRELERDSAIAGGYPVLGDAIPHVGHVAIRNRGTVGGSIAHADSAAELPVVLTALGGSVTLQSKTGTREVAAEDFFQGFLMTSATPDEILTSVSFPARGAGGAFVEFARRPGDFALVSCACAAAGDGSDSLRLALGGVASAPVVVEADADPTAAASAVDAGVDPAADVHGSAEYRRHLARQLVKQAVTRAAERKA